MEHHRRDLPWRSCSHPSKLASDATPSIWRAFVSSILPGRGKRNTHWVFLDCPGVGNGPNTSRPSSFSGALHITVDDFVREAALARYNKMKGNAPERLVSGSDDFTMFLWEPAVSKHPKTRMTGHQQLVNHVYFSPDGQWIASASFDKSVKLWNGITGKFFAAFRGHVGPVYQISWSADSRLLLSGSKDSTLKIWDIKTQKLKQDLPGHADEVFAVDWSPDGEKVASGGKDRVLKLWMG